uniref:Uncharacterized protein n=1 Tax=Meleagris gallopavo TaxID=9103 RepID=A0A803YSJ8_MELGA
MLSGGVRRDGYLGADCEGSKNKVDARSTLTYDTLRFEYEDFPETKEPVWILGRKYSVFTGILHTRCYDTAEDSVNVTCFMCS